MKPGCWCCVCVHAHDPDTGCAVAKRDDVQAWIDGWAARGTDHTDTEHEPGFCSHPPGGLPRCPGFARRGAAAVDAVQLSLLAGL